jgi:hypothetical protein
MANVRQDNVQIKLEIDGSQSRTELDNLTRKAQVLQQGLKEMKRGTEEYIAANKELREVNKRIGELRTEIGLSGLSMSQLDKLSKQLNRDIKDLVPGTESFINKSRELREVDTRLSQLRQEVRGVQDDLGKAGGGFGDFVKKAVGFAGIQLGVEAVVEGAKELGKEIFNTTAKFETFEAVLTTALGDKSAAQYAMQQIADLAAKTPFSVDELTASYVKFVNRGIVPSTAEMQKLADVAASQGKSFDQLTEAVLDAGTGEFERLKEFGIQASKSGDQVELSFKGVTKTVANTPTAINAALVSFGELNGVMGSTASISETLEGQTSNLGDQVDQLEVQIGKGLRPVFVLLLTTAGRFLDFLRESKGPLSAFINYFIDLYNNSLAVRLVVQGLGAGFQNAYSIIKNTLGFLVADLVAAGKVIKGVFTLDFGLIKQGYNDGARALVDAVKKTGSEMGQNYKGALTRAISTDKVALLGVSDADAKAAADSYDKAAARVGAGAKQKAAADAAKKMDLEALKDREANIRTALALVASGSAEELRLKKLDVAAKRDIELVDEKKTAAERKVIRAETTAAIRKLDEDYQKKQLAEAEKHAKEQVEVEKRIADLKAGLLTDETEKRIQQLTAAAEKEQATAKGTAEQVAQQRQLIEQKLAADVLEVRRAATVKAGLAELEIEKMNSELIKNQFDRKNAEIDIAAREAKLKLLATDKDYAVKSGLIDSKALADHKANEDERVVYHQQVMDKIADMEEETNQLNRARKLRGEGVTKQDRKDAAAQELAEKMGRLNKEEQAEQDSLAKLLEDKLITTEEFEQAQSALFANSRAKRKELNDQFADDEKNRWKSDFAEQMGYMNEKIQFASDLLKDFSDIELKKEEANKKKRLASLEAEYKAGRISKEGYEAAKSEIETNYDAKTRQIKKEAAEKEKVAKIAQAVITTAVNVVEAFPNPALMAAAGVLGALQVGKIVATPIPEFEKGGFFGRAARSVKQYATGGRINPTAGVADVGQRHSGGGIRMVDGATGQHLGEWERGEAYMILSRDTYANNKHLVDELIDTSLHRGGAPVRPREGYYEDGGTFGGSPAAPSTTSARADGQELVQLLRETRDAIRALPSRQYIGWDQDDTAEIEQRLNERIEDRTAGQVR